MTASRWDEMKPFVQKLLPRLVPNRIRNSDAKITYTWKSKQVSDASLTTLHELIKFFARTISIRKERRHFGGRLMFSRVIDISLLNVQGEALFAV